MTKKLWMVVALVLASCGGSSASTTAETSGETTSGTEAATTRDACVATMTRERECQSDFIPALVALRVRLDQPSGMAQRDAAEGRDALVAAANTEYATDASDENIQSNCAQIEQMPAEQAEQWGTMMRECLAASDCGSFVECDIRFTEARFSGGH